MRELNQYEIEAVNGAGWLGRVVDAVVDAFTGGGNNNGSNEGGINIGGDNNGNIIINNGDCNHNETKEDRVPNYPGPR